GQPRIFAYPNRRSNAGVGWLVSMGRLIATDDPTNYTSGYNSADKRWLYESSDGHNHVLDTQTPSYTTDGSYLRMKVVDTTHRTIEFPDGTVQTFEDYSSSGRSDWRLTSTKDAFLNSLAVSYPTPTVGYASEWWITDAHGRVQKLFWKDSTTS